MSVIVINSTSPSFVCSSPACYIDAESIDTSYVYDSEYVSACDTVDFIPYSGGSGTVGPTGATGADGVGISSITGPTTVGLVDTYTVHYTDLSTSTFDVTNGEDGVTPTITVGTVTTGAAGSSVIITDVGVAPNSVFDFTIPRGDTGATGTAGTNGYSIRISTGVPTDGTGYNNDLCINILTYDLYKKIGGTWGSPIGNIKGSTGASGSDGADGSNGDQWTHGVGDPVDATPLGYNLYYIDTDSKNLWLKTTSAIVWSNITNMNGDKYLTTSTTSITLDAMTIGDTVAITTASTTMSYSIGQFLVIANSTTNYFLGKVLSYSAGALSVEVTYFEYVTAGALASWTLNLAGVVESDVLPDWYEITATAGTGTISSRTFTGPSGWTIGAANTIPVTGLSSSTVDLTIKHDTGFNAVECAVYANDGSKYTKLQLPVAYATMYADLTDIAMQLASFCTLAQALKIYVKLI